MLPRTRLLMGMNSAQPNYIGMPPGESPTPWTPPGGRASLPPGESPIPYIPPNQRARIPGGEYPTPITPGGRGYTPSYDSPLSWALQQDYGYGPVAAGRGDLPERPGRGGGGGGGGSGSSGNSGSGSRPSWMPGNAYRYGIDREDWGSTINDDIVKQTWWRAPQWLYNGGSQGGNGIMWNPLVGWQTTQDIKGYYHSMGDTPVTDDLFMQHGWTNRLGSNDWMTYWDPYTGPRATADSEGGSTGESPYLPVIDTNPWTGEPINPSSPYDQDISEAEMLENFGYTGPIDLNRYESDALRLINDINRYRDPLATLDSAKGFYGDVLSGAYSPYGSAFRDAVYNKTRAGMVQNLEDSQRRLAEDFSHRGGYFGGKHAVSQAKLQSESNQQMNELLAGLNLEGYKEDLASRFQAGTGMQGVAPSEQSIADQILSDLLTGGNMVTQRELTNRSELQNALQRAYDDWNRARGESLMPFNYALSLLGLQPHENIVQQPQQSVWGQFLGGLGTGIGGGLGTLLGRI